MIIKNRRPQQLTNAALFLLIFNFVNNRVVYIFLEEERSLAGERIKEGGYDFPGHLNIIVVLELMVLYNEN